MSRFEVYEDVFYDYTRLKAQQKMKTRVKDSLSGISFLALAVFLSILFLRGEEETFAKKRREMVRYQLRARDIHDKKVLEVMGTVPRHLFVHKRYQSQAYEDHPLPIDEGQTISQPYIVALMTQYLGIEKGDKVLEVGTGSGYQAAVLAHLTDEVYSIEIKERLAHQASERLKSLGYDRVRVKRADGYFGWEEHGPFDAVIVTCAANHLPPPLFEQLKEGGRLIIPLGSTLFFQNLTLVTKVGGKPQVEHVLSVSFVPMTGEAQKRKR